MHYQTRILPINGEDGFVLAVVHGQHQVGGEDTRETARVRLIAGSASAPGQLRDFASLCLPARPAAPQRAASLRKQAQLQEGMAAEAKSLSARESRLDYVRSFQHAAHLASQDSVRVPRVALGSRAGRILLGYSPSWQDHDGEALPGLLSLVDAADGRTLSAWSSERKPLDSTGKPGLRGMSAVQLARPVALSLDGNEMLFAAGVERGLPMYALCRLDEALSERARTALEAQSFLAVDGGWIAVGTEQVRWLGPQLELLSEQRLPRGATVHAASATPCGRWLAIAASADCLVLDRNGRKPRRFSPHVGARRELGLQPSLSSCGRWLASRCGQSLALTCLESGRSWPVGMASDQVEHVESEGGYVVRDVVPAALAFVGGALLVAERGEVCSLSIELPADVRVSEHGRQGMRKPFKVKPSMTLDALVRSARLQRVAPALARVHSPALRLQSKPVGTKGWQPPGRAAPPPLGSSRIGGWPDLPRGMAWPRWDARPMAFLAQINLAEAHAAQPGLALPARGLLSFFIGCSEQTYSKDDDPRERYMIDPLVGTEAQGRGAWRVLHTIDLTDLEHLECNAVPLPELIDPCALRMVAGGLALPHADAAPHPRLLASFTAEERDDYEDLVAQLTPSDDPVHQLMGYPQLIQGGMPEHVCELASTGQNPYAVIEPHGAEWESLNAQAAEWALLLQLTSDPGADMLWGDGGHFYFYGQRAAMAEGDFSGVWVYFEC